jgi:hypothetical protein
MGGRDGRKMGKLSGIIFQEKWTTLRHIKNNEIMNLTGK